MNRLSVLNPTDHQPWPASVQSPSTPGTTIVKNLVIHENSTGWWRLFDVDDSHEPLFRSDRLRAEDRAREICRAAGGGTVRVVNHQGEQVAEYAVQPAAQPRRTGTPERRRSRWAW